MISGNGRSRQIGVALGVALSILILIMYFYLVPLGPFMLIDGTSCIYMALPLSEIIKTTTELYGIYRVIALVFKSVAYSLFVTTGNFLAITIVAAFSARLLFMVMVARLLDADWRVLPMAIALAVAPLFWIDSSLVLSRALNELLAALVAAGYLWLAAKWRLNSFRIAALTLAYAGVTVLTYESYAAFAVLAVLVAPGTRVRPIIGAIGAAAAIVMLLQFEGSVLRSPKLVSNLADMASRPTEIGEYIATKIQQVVDTLIPVSARVAVLPLTVALAVGGLAWVGSPARQPVGVLGGRGLLLVFLSFTPAFAHYIVISSSKSLGRISWTLLANGATTAAVGGAIAAARWSWLRHVAALGVVVTVVISSMLTQQLGAGLARGDSVYLNRSVFRNFSDHLAWPSGQPRQDEPLRSSDCRGGRPGGGDAN